MRISRLIEKLEEIKAKEGDLNVCSSTNDHYWGRIDRLLSESDELVKEHAQPHGPKSGKSEKAVVFEY